MINKKTNIPLIYEYINDLLNKKDVNIVKNLILHLEPPNVYSEEKNINMEATHKYYLNIRHLWAILEVKTNQHKNSEEKNLELTVQYKKNETFIESLRNPEKLQEILKLIQKTPITTTNIENSITINNKRYDLDKKQCCEIYNIIANITQKDKKKFENKRHKLPIEDKIKPIIEKALQMEMQTNTKDKQIFELFRIVINNNTQIEAASAITYVLCDALSLCMAKTRTNLNDDTPYEARFIDVLKSIGEGLFSLFLQHMTEKQFNFLLNQKKNTKDIALLLIQKLFKQYQMKEFTELFNFIAKVRKDPINKNKKDFMNNVFSHLLLYKDSQNYVFQNDWGTICIKLGGFIIDLLANDNILEIQKATKDEKKSYTKVLFVDNLKRHIQLPSSFTKPKLTRKMKTSIIPPINNILFHLNTNDKSATDPFKVSMKSEILMKKKGNNYFNDLSTKYTINTPLFAESLEELNELNYTDFECMFDKPQSKKATQIALFIEFYYQINVNIKFQNECSISFLHKLVSSLHNFKDSNPYTDKKKLLKLGRYINYMIKIKAKNKKKIKIKTSPTWIIMQDYESMVDGLKELYIFKNEIQTIISFYNKIIARKDFLRNLFEDLSIYQHFDHFYLEKNITGAGRLSIKPFYINYMTDKVSRAFILYKTNKKEISEALYKDYHKIIIKQLPHASADLKNLTYENFKQQTEQEQKAYINSFFIDLNIQELLDKKIKKLSELKLYVKCKNNTTAFLGISVLHYYLNQELYPYKELIVYMDSSMNGTQLFAILFNNKNAAKYSNLIGDSKFDLNLEALGQFNNCLDSLSSLSTISTKFFALTNNDLKTKDPMKILSLIYNKLNNTFGNTQAHVDKTFISLEDTTNHFLNYDLKTLPENYIASFQKEMSPDTLNQIFSLIDCKRYPLLLKWKQHPLLQHCLIILLNNCLQLIKQETPNVLSLFQYREVIKTRILAAQYGMKDYAGQDCILKNLLAVAAEKAITINYWHAFCLAEFLSNFFVLYFSVKIMPYQKIYSNLSRLIKKPIVFKNKFFSVKLTPKKYKEQVHNITLKKHRFQVKSSTLSNIFNLTKYRSSFAPCWIHFMEATLMFYFIQKALYLNRQVYFLNLNFCYSHIYDNFGSNFMHIVFLKPLIKECYYAVNNDNFAEQLLIAFEDNETLITYLKKELIQKKVINDKPNPSYWHVELTGKFFVKY